MIYWVYKGENYATSSQFAEMCEVALCTVHSWCRKGMPHAPVEKIYMIPVDRALYWVKKNSRIELPKGLLD
jgi:hypothetical protein